MAVPAETRPEREPPKRRPDESPTPSRPVWALRHVRQDPIGFLESLAARGDVVPFSLGRQAAFLLNSPALIERVLVSHHEAFAKGRAFERAKRLLGNGLLTADGPLHHRRRRLMTPAFHRARMDHHGEMMVMRAARLRHEWRPGCVIDVAHDMQRLTLAIAGRALFGVEIDDARAADVRAALTEAIRSLDPLMSLLAPIRRMHPARVRLLSVVEDVIDDRLRSSEERDDLLSLLLEAVDVDSQVSRDQLRDDVLTMLLAGHDTIASALTWTWDLLSRHPQVEARLHAELDEVCGGRLPSTEDLGRLTYTRGVFAESLRIFPPAWVMARRALVDFQAGDTMIPAGALVVMSQFLMHRDARFFPEPLAFDPGRWQSDSSASRPKLAYFPFGAGPRSCIGEGFAWMESTLLLATLAQRWRLRPTTPDPVGIQARVTLCPKGRVLMHPQPRS
jgi:cytochrome P450